MVQNKKTRPRHIVDNGSSARGTGDSERSADKSDQSLPSARQVQSQISYRAKAGLHRLNSAVLAQATKDLCDEKEKSVDKVLAWTNTPMFREICDAAGLDHANVAGKMRTVADMPLRIRRDLIRNLVNTSKGWE